MPYSQIDQDAYAELLALCAYEACTHFHEEPTHTV